MLRTMMVTLGMLALGCPAALGATFTVDDPVDAPDAKPGDRQCVTAAATCSLRAAVQEANASAGEDVVLISAGTFTLAIAPTTEAGSSADREAGNGDLDITETLTVRGAGARRTTVHGGGLDRVFSSESGAIVTITDMTITGGDATGGGSSQTIGMGGGVWNKSTMTLERLRLIGNHADGGGAVFSIPRTYLTIRDSVLANNTAVEGGGIRIDSGGEVVGTTITANKLATVPRAALLPDEMSGYGGGIDHRGGNDVTIVNSTIAGNHALKGGGGFNAGQGYAPVSDKLDIGRVRLRNTIIAGNTSDAGPANCNTHAVVIESAGHNLASDDSCFLTAEGDLPGRDPLLSALKFHGGPSETLALRRGSPAINAAGTICTGRDQRGVKRPLGGACDIGAYEWRAPKKKKPKSG